MFFVQYKHLGKLCWVLFSSWLYFGKLSMTVSMVVMVVVIAPESDLCLAAAFLKRLWEGLSLTRSAPPLTGLALHTLILHLC